MDARQVATIAQAAADRTGVLLSVTAEGDHGTFRVKISHACSWIVTVHPCDCPGMTPADVIGPATEAAVRKLVDRIAAEVRPIDAGTRHFKAPLAPEPAKPEVWSFLACPQVELMP